MNIEFVKKLLSDNNISFSTFSIETIRDRDIFKKTYALNGEFKSKGATYKGLILKKVDDLCDNEIRFYNESNEVLKGISPDVLYADLDEKIIILEKVESLSRWDEGVIVSTFKTLSVLHSNFWNKSDILWVPRIKEKEDEIQDRGIRDMFDKILTNDRLEFMKGHYEFIITSYRHLREMDSLLFHNSSLLHGDVHYLNSGMKNNAVVFFDWSTIKYGNIAFDLCYLIEQTHELYRKNKGNKSKVELIDMYLKEMSSRGIVLDKSDFIKSYNYTYLYRCITNILPIYIGRYLNGEEQIYKYINNLIIRTKELYSQL